MSRFANALFQRLIGATRQSGVALIVLAALIAAPSHASEIEIAILHTNDMHQHLDPLSFAKKVVQDGSCALIDWPKELR